MRVMIKRKLLRLLDTMQSMHRIIAAADMQCVRICGRLLSGRCGN